MTVWCSGTSYWSCVIISHSASTTKNKLCWLSVRPSVRPSVCLYVARSLAKTWEITIIITSFVLFLQVLCLMLEMEVLPSEDAKMQVVHTLQSTIEGHDLYMKLCEKLSALKQLVGHDRLDSISKLQWNESTLYLSVHFGNMWWKSEPIAGYETFQFSASTQNSIAQFWLETW